MSRWRLPRICIYIYIEIYKGNPTRFGKDNIGFGRQSAALFSSLGKDCYVPRLAYLIIRYIDRWSTCLANSGCKCSRAFFFRVLFLCRGYFLRTEETGLRLFDGVTVRCRIYIETTIIIIRSEIKYLITLFKFFAHKCINQ